MTYSKIVDLLRERHQHHSPLQKLLRHADRQHAWTAQLRALLPERLGADCRITEVRGPTVVVVCGNAASATRLRFMSDELLVELARLADFRGAERLQIRVSAA